MIEKMFDSPKNMKTEKAFAKFEKEFWDYLVTLNVKNLAYNKPRREPLKRVFASAHSPESWGYAMWRRLSDKEKALKKNISTTETCMIRYFALHDHVAYAMLWLEDAKTLDLKKTLFDSKIRKIWP